MHLCQGSGSNSSVGFTNTEGDNTQKVLAKDADDG